MTDEILRIVVGDRVNTSVVVGLCLEVDHAISGLQTNLKLFTRKQVWLSAGLREGLQILGLITRLLINELSSGFVAEFTPFHGNARSNQRPLILNSESLNLFDGLF